MDAFERIRDEGDPERAEGGHLDRVPPSPAGLVDGHDLVSTKHQGSQVGLAVVHAPATMPPGACPSSLVA